MLAADIPPKSNYLHQEPQQEDQKSWILNVVALKTPKLRGQAWLVFVELTAASNAFRQMQNFPFYDKPMRIQSAKPKSDCVAKVDGSYVQREKKQEEKAERKRRAEEAQQSAMLNGTVSQSNGGPKGPFHHGNLNAQDHAAPNNILFIQNLPHETTNMMLQLLFEQYPGFREVRMIEAESGIAFVEYEDEEQFCSHAAPSGFHNRPTISHGHYFSLRSNLPFRQ